MEMGKSIPDFKRTLVPDKHLLHEQMGAFGPDRKRTLAAKLTDAVEEVQPGLRDLTMVTIDETPEGDRAVGGEAITAGKVATHAKNVRQGWSVTRRGPRCGESEVAPERD